MFAGVITVDLYDPALNPNPERSADALAALLIERRDDLRLGAYLTMLAVTFLLAFGAWLREVLARVSAATAASALVHGGIIAIAVLLLVETVFVFAAAEPARYEEDAQVAKAWFVLSWNYANVFAPPAVAVIGGTTAAALSVGMLPRWLAWASAAATALVILLIVTNMPGVAVAVFLLWVLVTSATLVVRPPDSGAPARRESHGW